MIEIKEDGAGWTVYVNGSRYDSFCDLEALLWRLAKSSRDVVNMLDGNDEDYDREDDDDLDD